jgi:hypothetical protein
MIIWQWVHIFSMSLQCLTTCVWSYQLLKVQISMIWYWLLIHLKYL